MADARINETVYIPIYELHWSIAEYYADIGGKGGVGVVVYSNSYNPNGVQTLIIGELK